jgi:glutathione S-transferase
MLRLLTIPISHYCEKARWALDRAGLSYREERHVQGVHRICARRAGGGATVPVLITEDRVIGESAQIVEWVDERLEPEDRLLFGDQAERAHALELCARFDGELGPKGRRLMYVHIFTAPPQMVLEYNNAGVPRWEDRAIRWGWPLAKRGVGRVLGVTPGVEVSDEAAVWREFDFVAEQVADGRPYLLGERFGAADLTFAALAAAVLVPTTYGTRLPQPDVLPAPIAQIVTRAREHPAGRFAQRVIDEQRRARVSSASPAGASPATSP